MLSFLITLIFVAYPNPLWAFPPYTKTNYVEEFYTHLYFYGLLRNKDIRILHIFVSTILAMSFEDTRMRKSKDRQHNG